MTKKVMVSFPEEFLEEVDRIADEELRSRSELIREALRVYMGARQLGVHPGDLRQVRAAVESMYALAQVAPGSGEDSAEDVRYWRGEAPMISRLVPDTSVVLKWIRQEEILADRALGLLQGYLDGRSQISVPALLGYEFANVLRYKADLTTAQVETAVQALFDLELEWIAPSPTVIRRAVVIAHEHDTSVYDASFAALAEGMGATFVTADARLARRLAALQYVIFLGDVEGAG